METQNWWKPERTFKNDIERCDLETVSQREPKSKEEGKNWQERTYDESLILAQDERWRRA